MSPLLRRCQCCQLPWPTRLRWRERTAVGETIGEPQRPVVRLSLPAVRSHTHSKGVAAAAKTIMEASAAAIAAAEARAADSIALACSTGSLPAGLVKQYAAASVRAAGGSATALLTALPVLLAVAELQREGGSDSRFEADAEKREASDKGDSSPAVPPEQRSAELSSPPGIVVLHAFSSGVSVEVSIGALDGSVLACQAHVIEPSSALADGLGGLEDSTAVDGDLSEGCDLADDSSGFSALQEEAELLQHILAPADHDNSKVRSDHLDAALQLAIGVRHRAAAAKRLLCRLQAAHLAGASSGACSAPTSTSTSQPRPAPAASTAKWMLAVEQALRDPTGRQLQLALPLWLPDRSCPMQQQQRWVAADCQGASATAASENMAAILHPENVTGGTAGATDRSPCPFSWRTAVQEALWQAATPRPDSQVSVSPSGVSLADLAGLPAPMLAWAASRLRSDSRPPVRNTGRHVAIPKAKAARPHWVRPGWLPRLCPMGLDDQAPVAAARGDSKVSSSKVASQELSDAIMRSCAAQLQWRPCGRSCAPAGLLAMPVMRLPLAMPVCEAADAMLRQALIGGEQPVPVPRVALSSAQRPQLTPAAGDSGTAGSCHDVPAWAVASLVHAPRLAWQPTVCQGHSRPLRWAEGRLVVELQAPGCAATLPDMSASGGGKRPASDMDPDVCACRVSLRTVTVVSHGGTDRLIRSIPLFPAECSTPGAGQPAATCDPVEVAARWNAAASCCSALRLASGLLGTCEVGQCLWTTQVSRTCVASSACEDADAGPKALRSRVRGTLVLGAEISSSGALRIRLLVMPGRDDTDGLGLSTEESVGHRAPKAARPAASGKRDKAPLLHVSIHVCGGTVGDEGSAPAPAAGTLPSLTAASSPVAVLAARGISLRVDMLSANSIEGTDDLQLPCSGNVATEAWASAGLSPPQASLCVEDSEATFVAAAVLLHTGSLGTLAATLLRRLDLGEPV